MAAAKKNNYVCKMRVRCFGDMFRDVFVGMRVLLKTDWRDAVQSGDCFYAMFYGAAFSKCLPSNSDVQVWGVG